MVYRFKIEGLDCANCALELEEELNKIDGVKSASVNFMASSVTVDASEDVISNVKNTINSFEEVKIKSDLIEVSYKICGLDCANCALELEEELNKIDGCNKASVSFVNQKVNIICDEKVKKEIENTINNFEEVKIVDSNNKTYKKWPKDLILLIISGVLFITTFILTHTISNEKANTIISYVGYLSSYLIVGYEVLWKMILSFKNKHFFDENTLMSIASLSAIMITIFTDLDMLSEAAAVIILYQLGEYLQGVATNNSRKQIESLVMLKSNEANLFVNGDIISVDVEEVNKDDIILIKPGEKVPVDIVITDGESNFDGASLTGESEYKDFKVGDEVLSGYININSVVKGKVIRPYNDSAVKKIIDLVENSTDKKGKSEKFITKFARIYTPIVFAISFIFVIIGIIITLATGNNVIVDFIVKALTILVISCPCALVISVPLTYFGGIGTAAKRGILVKGATNLDELANVKTAMFDKTGTLTYGKFYIKDVVSSDKELVLKLASSLEHLSNHPISNAFESADLLEVTNFEEIFGHGLKGLIDDKICLIGNKKMMDKFGIDFDEINSSDTLLYVSYDNKYLGYIVIADKEREEIDSLFNNLASLGVDRKILLTGDSKEKALNFAKNHNFDDIKYELLPEEKHEIAKTESASNNTLYVGDGINDAPVMLAATTSFSMGKLGSDIAVEVSDIVLINEDLNSITNSIKIAKKTRRIVYENIILSISFKVIMMVLGAFSLIPLWLAVFSDVGIMLLAVLNSLRIRHIK